MKLRTKSHHGTLMMLDLAQHYGANPVKVKEVAKRQNLPMKYLEQILIPLKKANLVKSMRGYNGGYVLAIPPDKITVSQIVKALEGSLDLVDCIRNPELCKRSKNCAARTIWKMMTDSLHETLDSFSLTDMVNMAKGEGPS